MAAPLKLRTFIKLSKLFYFKGNVNRSCGVLCQRNFNTTLSENTIAEKFIQATEAKSIKRSICRTPESNPSGHTFAHEGMYYTIPQEDVTKWLDKAFTQEIHRLNQAFQEMSIMVRRPALEVLEYMRAASYNLPTIRYVLYGYHGCGKSITLGHIMHNCALQGWLLLHVPWASHWNRYYIESQVSSYKTTRFDQPLCGMDWLTHFRRMNVQRLKELDIRLVNRYVWNKRESADVGSSLLEVIDFGLSRTKYVCDVVGAVLKEIKLQASERGFNVLVAVDGVNAFWEMSKIRRFEDKTYVASKDLTLTHNFMNMLQNDWAGGAVVCTVDTGGAKDYKDQLSYMPLHLLQKEGFEFLDPFIPIHVPNYSDKEVRSNIEYFIEQKWLQNPHALTEDRKKELIFLSCKNPRELFCVTRSW